MTNKDIRWIQRFSNFKKALKQLKEFIDKGSLNELEKLGLIHSFENTCELAWNTLSDLLESLGEVGIYGPRDIIRRALKLSLISDGDTWMEMIEDRNSSNLIYDEEIARIISDNIINKYYPEFRNQERKFQELAKTVNNFDELKAPTWSTTSTE